MTFELGGKDPEYTIGRARSMVGNAGMGMQERITVGLISSMAKHLHHWQSYMKTQRFPSMQFFLVNDSYSIKYHSID